VLIVIQVGFCAALYDVYLVNLFLSFVKFLFHILEDKFDINQSAIASYCATHFSALRSVE